MPVRPFRTVIIFVYSMAHCDHNLTESLLLYLYMLQDFRPPIHVSKSDFDSITKVIYYSGRIHIIYIRVQ